jgi:hypothetical protein
MGVPCDVLEDLLRSSGERWLGVDLPIYFPGGRDVAQEGVSRPQWFQRGKELQLAGIEGSSDLIQEGLKAVVILLSITVTSTSTLLSERTALQAAESGADHHDGGFVLVELVHGMSTCANAHRSSGRRHQVMDGARNDPAV